ncbi:response regulator [Pararcticibacter amylolyticus]|uniref:Inactive Receiver domain-containing protein n=1 Tax=Pararcticibacter amylolyticus TaxID=2173175 RepID=A0A2U2P9L5_9SPHI|nr:response regulator [Pararcticibacter amylolyticus]PWG78060.1 hypothetical protein DDR33_24280 [Pararcticibacter amylolyticus]
MAKTFIIGRSNEAIPGDAGYPIIELPLISTDEEIHDFLEKAIKDHAFDMLIIPLVPGEIILRLKIALHIRLTESLHEKRLIPILFTSNDRFAKIHNTAGSLGNLLSTAGCKYVEYEKSAVSKVITTLQPLGVDDYKSQFLNSIIIHPDEKSGKHSLANQWGAISLSRAANLTVEMSDPELSKSSKQLYFKYVSALNDNYSSIGRGGLRVLGHVSIGLPDKIKSNGKRILLIDDEAEKGWASVLRKIFKTSKANDFQVINEKIRDVKNLNVTSKELIDTGNFDLYLIDLRLDGSNEEKTVTPDSFSGAKLLQYIKSQNEGNQIIMFTASNKAWNMKSLLDAGADGYYIKESPEFKFPVSFSKENYGNFKNEVQKCFELGFLKNIVTLHRDIQNIIDQRSSAVSHNYRQFYNRSISSLAISLELLKKTVSSKKYFNLAYLTYYQLLEEFVAQRENLEVTAQLEWYVNNRSQKVITNNGSNCRWELTHHQDKNNGDYFTKVRNNRVPRDQTVGTLAKVSFVLAFQFGKSDSDLKEWGKINQIRNQKAGHGNNRHFVTLQELNNLLAIVELFLKR